MAGSVSLGFLETVGHFVFAACLADLGPNVVVEHADGVNLGKIVAVFEVISGIGRAAEVRKKVVACSELRVAKQRENKRKSGCRSHINVL